MVLVYVLLGIIAVWLILVSVYLFTVYSHFRNLTKGVKQQSLLKILDNVLKKETLYKKEISSLRKDLELLKKDVLGDFQKCGLVRFNPFNELGGDHSFALTLLDGHETGFILTGLHTRERTRVYLKPITNGKCKYDLSEEETKALKIAIKE